MKTILACGTKQKSLSKVIKKYFAKKGYKVYLFSRNAPLNKSGLLRLDLCYPTTFKNIPSLQNIDTIIFSQDSGTAFGNFNDLTYKEIHQFLDSKILGSILFSRFLLEQIKNSNQKIKLIWMCGTYGLKQKNYMLYHITNIAIKSFTEELNTHYSNLVEAYYLVTPFMNKTTVGRLYNQKLRKNEEGENPEKLLPYLDKIIQGKTKSGIVVLSSRYMR